MKRLIIYLVASLTVCQYTYSMQNKERPIVAITIPKCGTHLLAKCIALLTGKLYTPLHEFYKLEDKNFILPKHNFTLVHAPHNKRIEDNLIKQNSIKFFLYRDPRDQVVSFTFFAKYMNETGMNTIHPRLNIPLKLVDFNTLLLDFIVSGPGVYTGRTVAQFYDYFLPWLHLYTVCPVKFENLIGPRGGGTAQAQAQEIKRISTWLGLRKSDQELARVAQVLFGKSTFREGKIGAWRKYFTQEHKQAFKQVAGKLLIDLGYEKDLNW